MPIKIWICDFFPTFDINNNRYVDILKSHYEVKITDKEPDFLFYSVFGFEHIKFHNCTKICFALENSSPNFNECDYAVGIENIVFGDRYFRLKESVKTSDEVDSELAKRKFCNFIYTNDFSGEGALLRKKFCRLLSQYKRVDCPGVVLNNMKNAIEPRYGDWIRGKLNFIKDYKFTIAFENVNMAGGNSEKIRHPLMVHSLPIYWGDPLVGRDYNTKAFINVSDFNSLEEVVEYVKYLDTHDEEYLEILRQNPMNPDYKNPYPYDSLEEFLCAIIERGNHPIVKAPHMMHDHLLNLLCDNTARLADFESVFGDASKAKACMDICMSLDTVHRHEIYPVLEDVYRKEPGELYSLLIRQEKRLMKSERVEPANLRELCLIAKCLMHLGRCDEAETIKRYVLQEDPDSTLAQTIPAEKGKRGGRGIDPEQQRLSAQMQAKTEEDMHWPQVYHDTIRGSEWLQDKAVSPSRSGYRAVGYHFLYVLYRILDVMHPGSILEIGLSQGTRLTSQFAGYFGLSHAVVEHDREWVDFFQKSYQKPMPKTKIYLAPLQLVELEGNQYYAYQNFDQVIKAMGHACDLIVINGPASGRSGRAKRDIVPYLPHILNKDFAIVINDAGGISEQNLIKEMQVILAQHKIESVTGMYQGNDNRHMCVMVSKAWKFLTVM